MMHKARGFTLVEMTLLVLVAGFMAAVFAASLPVESAEEKAGITVRSSQLLTHFIELYFRKMGDWPDEGNGCDTTDAFIALAAEVDAQAWAPAGGGPLTNGWGEAVNITCTSDTLEIRQHIPQPEMRAYMAHQLANTTSDSTNSDLVTLVHKASYIGIMKVIRTDFKKNSFHVHSKVRYKDLASPDPDDVGAEGVLFNCPGALATHVHSIRMPSVCAKDEYFVNLALTDVFEVRGFNINPNHYSNKSWHYVMSVDIAAPGDPISTERDIDRSCGSDTDYLDFVVSCEL